MGWVGIGFGRAGVGVGVGKVWYGRLWVEGDWFG